MDPRGSHAVASGSKKQSRITRFLTVSAQKSHESSLLGLPALRGVLPALWPRLGTPEQLALRLSCRELRGDADALFEGFQYRERAYANRRQAGGRDHGESEPEEVVADYELAAAAFKSLLARPGVRPTRLTLDVAIDSQMESGGADNVRRAAEALASGLPLVLRERTASLTSLRISLNCPELPEAATDAKAGCTRLKHLEIGLPPRSSGQAAIVGLTNLCSLTLHNAFGDWKQDAADLGFLSALSAASGLTRFTRRPVSDWMWSDDPDAAPLDVAALSGLCSLVELLLEGAVLDGEGMRCLALLTALTRLEAHTLRVAESIPPPEVAEARPSAPPPAPLSWPMPPALRHLSLELAEVAALAALRPPQSLEVVEFYECEGWEDMTGSDFSGLFFSPLPDLTFFNCDLTVGAQPVLHRLTRLRHLDFFGPNLWSGQEVQLDLVRGQLLGLCAAEPGRPDLELVLDVCTFAEQEVLEGAVAWVERQLQLLGSSRKVQVQFRL
ncbi:hypothetical protein GPECTOR_10g992 [Gonium pectorale]|uniref:F-box domain-containing protein n=1 Tax=Gonium pectorale TaxID=33097 RepID=A0A150GRJ5_GONPE|nr:hypothetical protein GPECTOR_10g992 [Gonium pectorale]|eukprot:KXZ52358.1 hypothetical protein GPECTOR_10g992 [Gonium pectorale]